MGMSWDGDGSDKCEYQSIHLIDDNHGRKVWTTDLSFRIIWNKRDVQSIGMRMIRIRGG